MSIYVILLLAALPSRALAQQYNSPQGRRDITINRGFAFPSISSTTGMAAVPAPPMAAEPNAAFTTTFGQTIGTPMGSTINGTIGQPMMSESR